MLRTVKIDIIKQAIIKLIYEASFITPPDLKTIYECMSENETSFLARETLHILKDNILIAEQEELPLCQDCGMTIIFLDIGQDVIISGGDIQNNINQAVEEAYTTYNLRKSIVDDPLIRKNTGTNTPAFIHTEIVPGDTIELTVYLKGGGSENMTALKMFRPTEPVEAIIDFIETTVVNAGPNPCPPLFLGIGLGGTADVALVNAKKAILRGLNSTHTKPLYQDLEQKITDRLNNTNVGPLGFGGKSTVGRVFIKEAPTHIATLPVALNLNCHSLRYRTVEI